jgi:hypothetical protein
MHLVERIGWLRAAVLGANDGIISTASWILGVAAAAAAKSDILLAGVAGFVAGAMSMAAGSTFLSAPNLILSGPILHGSGGSFAKIQSSRKRNWHKSISLAEWNPNSLGRLRFSSWPRMHWGRMRETSLEFQR